MKSVRDKWDEYAKATLPGNAGHDQVIVMRRAFYAGAYFIMAELFNAPTTDRTDEEIVEYYKAINKEVETFFLAVESGKA